MKSHISSLINIYGKRLLVFSLLILSPVSLFAASGQVPSIGPVRFEFIIFGLILAGVALFHKQTFRVALLGVTVLLVFKLIFDPSFNIIQHLFGKVPLSEQLLHRNLREGEWDILINLLGLLLGFSILSKIFEESGIPDILPSYLPEGWKGPFVLLIFVFIISTFLDNIAAALIGGTIALVVFRKRVHLGYVAALVAASNAGGSGSVVGDTTTTMMWIDGVAAANVIHGFIAAAVALLFFGWFASHQQDRYQKIQKNSDPGIKIDWIRIVIVALILAGAITSNILYNMPALGVWIAILLGGLLRPVPWKEVPGAIKGTVFLLCLVISASMVPVNELPDASVMTAFFMGLLSSVFDNIPLTRLCLEEGHFDWGMLAFTVGFGGSIIWFGSSTGVAMTNKFPESRNVIQWLKKGWHVAAAYLIGFIALYLIMGWNPVGDKEDKAADQPFSGYIHKANTDGRIPSDTKNIYDIRKMPDSHRTKRSYN